MKEQAENISATATVGHAFIGIGKGALLACNMDGSETEMPGFYPKVKTDGGKGFFYGPVEGKIKNDIKTKTDHYVFKKIDFADYIKVQLKLKEWEKKYEVTTNDCITFIADVVHHHFAYVHAKPSVGPGPSNSNFFFALLKQ